MTERGPNIVYSGLSRKVTRDGITVEVVIVRLEGETSGSWKSSTPKTRPSFGTNCSRPMKTLTPSSSGPLPRKGCGRFSTAGR